MKSLTIDDNEVIAETCRRSFYTFFLEFWDVIEKEQLVDNWHIQYICNELQYVAEKVFRREEKEYDLIINIPPGTSKSTIVTVMFNAWCWTKDPTLRFITSSYSGSVSIDHAVKTRDIINSDKYKRLFGIELRRDMSGKSQFKNTQGGERIATSTGGTITGKHAHFLISDDPINPKKTASEQEIKTTNEYTDRTLSSRKVDKKVSVQILIMQRLHPNDPTGYLLKKDKRVKHICLPGKVSENVKPKELKDNYKEGLLDATRMNASVMKDLRTDLGAYAFSGQIMQTPKPEEGGIWQKWFIPISREEIPRMPLTNDWDLAYTAKESNSASAKVTSGVSKSNVYITDIEFRWLEFPELIEWMKSTPNAHYVEPKASGKSAVQTLTRNGINAVEYNIATKDKIARTRDVTPTAESGRVYVADDILDTLYNHETQGILNLSPANPDIDLNDALVQALHRQGQYSQKAMEDSFSGYDEIERVF